ncbi:MAG: ComEC/Rec2 family competence protein [Bacteroidia bacterium]
MNLIHRAPLVRLLLPFIAGISAAIYMEEYSFWLKVLMAVLFSSIATFTFHKKSGANYRFRWLYGMTLSSLLFLAAYQITLDNTTKFRSSYFGNYISGSDFCLVKIEEPLVEKEKSIKMIGSVISTRQNKSWKSTSGKALFYLPKNELSAKLKYGDLVLVKNNFSEINTPQNPSEFDYKKYLALHTIYLQNHISAGNFISTGINKGNFIRAAAIRTQAYCLAVLKKYNVQGQEFAVTSALILGYKNDIDTETTSDYAAGGVLHVLSVSGLHVGIIFVVFNYLLFFLEKFRYGNFIKGIFLLAMLWFYAMLTGLSPSVLRASTMLSFVVIANAFHRNSLIYNTLAASAFLLLAINPHLIAEVGFQLSYLAVLGIVSIFPWIYRLWKTKYWLLDKIWSIVAVSFAAQFITFPLSMFYFHQFPNYFLVSNVVVIPLATLSIYAGILLFITGKLAFIAGFLSKILIFLIGGLNYFVKEIRFTPYSLTQGISINATETWIIYFGLFFMLMYIFRKKLNYLFIALGIFILLLTIQVFEQKSEQNQSRFIVYNVAKTSACDFIVGKNNFLIADTAFLNNPNEISLHITPNWFEKGILSHTLIGADTGGNYIQKNFFLKNKCIQFRTKKIIFVNEKINLPKKIIFQKLKVDYVIISHNPKTNLKTICQIYDFKKIIFDASNSKWQIEKWLKECNEQGIEAYSVVHSGAYEETI